MPNAAILAIVGGLIWLVGWQSFLWVQLPITALAGSIGVWLFYVQHQFEDTLWEREGDWDLHEAALHGSSHYDLPNVLRWFTANIGVHHVHQAEENSQLVRGTIAVQKLSEDVDFVVPGAMILCRVKDGHTFLQVQYHGTQTRCRRTCRKLDGPRGVRCTEGTVRDPWVFVTFSTLKSL